MIRWLISGEGCKVEQIYNLLGYLLKRDVVTKTEYDICIMWTWRSGRDRQDILPDSNHTQSGITSLHLGGSICLILELGIRKYVGLQRNYVP